MKKIAKLIVLAVILACVLVPTLTACNDSSTKGGDSLVIYNWEDYIAPETLEAFQVYYKETTGKNLNITYSTFDTNETMMTKVLKGDAKVDLICPSEYSIQKLMLADCLLDIKDMAIELQPTFNKYGIELDSMQNVEPAIMSVIESMFGNITSGDKTYDMTRYMLPYMWGTLGILYNTKYVTEEDLATGWGMLWNVNNSKVLKNKILMKDSIRDSYAAALFYMKEYDLLPNANSSEYNKPYSELSIQELINCTDKAMLDVAEAVLKEQRDYIAGYEVDFGKDDMLNEIVYVDLAWSGDALWAIEESEYDEETETYQLGYFVPEIGTNIWYDGWVVPKSVNNKLAAMMFIDFMSRPINSIQNSMEIGYTSAVAKSIFEADEDVCAFIKKNEYVLEEYFGDLGRYPVIDDNFGVMRDFGSANEKLVQMWERAKAGGGVPWELIYCVIAIAILVIIVGSGYGLKEYLKRRPRNIKLALTKNEGSKKLKK